MLCLVASTLSHSAYRAHLPNGYNVVGHKGLGHADPRGGGRLNPFGLAFKNAGFKWTRELCEADSDGDGESNGLELGDPCCRWSEDSSAFNGEAQFDSDRLRIWRVSHPGLATKSGPLQALATSGVAMPNCSSWGEDAAKTTSSAEFMRFYFKPENDIRGGETAAQEAALRARKGLRPGKGTGFTFADFFHGKSAFALYSVLAVFALVCVWEGRQTEAEQAVTPLQGAGCREQAVTPQRAPLQFSVGARVVVQLVVLLAAFVYTDGLSGSLHIVLDIPAVAHWPLIGSGARGFQDHHLDPEGITRLPLGYFLTLHTHSIVLLLLPGLLPARMFPGRSRFRAMTHRIFLAEFALLSDLMMASHRWAHTAPERLSASVRCLQRGVLISSAYHSQHHVSFDRNFSILAGWMDPVIDAIRLLVPHDSTLWAGLLVLYSVSVPLVFSYGLSWTVEWWAARRMKIAGRKFWGSTKTL